MTAILERRATRLRLRRAARYRVSAGLEAWLDCDEPTTLGTLNAAFGEKILAAACLALMAPSALPIPTAGATHALDLLALVFAGQLVFGRRTVWMPKRWRTRELGPKTQWVLRWLVRAVKRCERISHRRLAALLGSRLGEVVLGLVMVAFIAAAFVSPPFSGLDTLPSLAVVLIALAILMEDAMFAAVGLVIGIVGIALAIVFGVQATHAISGLLG